MIQKLSYTIITFCSDFQLELKRLIVRVNNFLLIQGEAEEALAEALPALEEAKIALQDLNKSDVTEIR